MSEYLLGWKRCSTPLSTPVCKDALYLQRQVADTASVPYEAAHVYCDTWRKPEWGWRVIGPRYTAWDPVLGHADNLLSALLQADIAAIGHFGYSLTPNYLEAIHGTAYFIGSHPKWRQNLRGLLPEGRAPRFMER